MALKPASITMRLALALALAGLWLALSPGESHACSCAYPGTPSKALERSKAVFAGRVVSIEPRANRTGWNSITIEFDVSTVWKGPNQQTMRMASPGINNSCHFPFEEGVEYLVYSLNGLEVNWCSPVRPLSEADADLDELGPGQTPPGEAPESSPVSPEQPAAGADLDELGPGQTPPGEAPAPSPVSPEQPVGGGCGPSPRPDGLLLAGLVAGLAGLGLGRHRRVNRP